jgi:hypothetical protein
MVGALGFWTAGTALAEEGGAPVDHKEQMMTHIKQALTEGQAGNTDKMIEHAKAAREEAKHAINNKSTVELEKASSLLNHAIYQTERTDTAAIVKKLEEAQGVMNSTPPKFENSQG